MKTFTEIYKKRSMKGFILATIITREERREISRLRRRLILKFKHRLGKRII